MFILSRVLMRLDLRRFVAPLEGRLVPEEASVKDRVFNIGTAAASAFSPPIA